MINTDPKGMADCQFKQAASRLLTVASLVLGSPRAVKHGVCVPPPKKKYIPFCESTPKMQHTGLLVSFLKMQKKPATQ